MTAPVDPAGHCPLGAVCGQIEQALDAVRGLAALLDAAGGDLPTGFELAALINLIGDRLADGNHALERLISPRCCGSSADGLR